MSHQPIPSRPCAPAGRRLQAVRVLLLSITVALVPLLRLRAERGGEPFPDDAVEKFKHALLVENNKNIRYKARLDEDAKALEYALAYRKQVLEQAAKGLVTPSDLGRALLLTDWPKLPKDPLMRAGETKYDRESRVLERRIREELTKRFIQAVRTTFGTEAATLEQGMRQIATANLVGEIVAGAGFPEDDLLQSLYQQLQPLAKDLAQLTTSSQFRVREAAARALGNFSSSAKVAAEALGKLLDRGYPESTRKAAAEALSSLSLSVSTAQQLRGSEPGVAVRESRRQNKVFDLTEVLTVEKPVARAAGLGLTDPSAGVRESCSQALRQASEALAYEVRGLLPSSTKDVDLPPADRPWSAKEARLVADRRKELQKQEEQIAPTLRAFRDHGAGLLKAACDCDPVVRFNARRTLDSLLQIRDVVRRLREAIPTPTKPIAPDNKDVTRAAAGSVRLVSDVTPVYRLPVPAVPASRLQGKDKTKDKDAPLDDKDEPKDKDKEAEKDKDDDDKDTDPIGTLLVQVLPGVVSCGIRDPNPEARRAAHEAVEAAGAAGAPYIGELIKSLKDKDLFVRWIAARTLGKLAPREADAVVAGLVALLDDVDLDPRIAAAKAIGLYGPDAAGAVPPLAERSLKGDAEWRLTAIKALESIGTASVKALPALAKLLTDIDPRIRTEAARTMGRFGPLAKDHLETLRSLTVDADSDVRKAASDAIQAIIPAK